MQVVAILFVLIAGFTATPVGHRLQERVYRTGEGVVPPTIEKEVKPEYPLSAMTAHVEGMVKLECIVQADGTVGDVRVTEPLHPDLDEAAMRALAAWRFKPGTKDGKAVPVLVDIEFAFALRDAPRRRKGPPVDSPEVYKKSDGVVMPAFVKDVKPSYTPQAMRDRAQGSVKLDCVILPDGTVGDVRLAQSLHPELDAESVRALRQWTFKPGTKDGVAVPVQVEIEMTFALGSGGKRLPGPR